MTSVSLSDLQRQNNEFRFLVRDQTDGRRPNPPEQPLMSLDDMVAKGEKLEAQFAAAQATLGSDPHYVTERRNFYCTFGDLFNNLLDYTTVKEGDPAQCLYAHKACEYYTKSAHPKGAMGLAYVFLSLGFYATAIHWFQLVERINQKLRSSDAEVLRLAAESRCQIQKLQHQNTTTDPALSLCGGFPMNDTPGLIMAYQPATPTPEIASHPGSSAGQTTTAGNPQGSLSRANPLTEAAQQEKFRRLEQQSLEEREKEQRIERGLCLSCGQPLRVVDKVARRHKHKECS